MYCFGRGGRTRTADPRVPNAVRYQLRYTPARTSIPGNPLLRQGPWGGHLQLRPGDRLDYSPLDAMLIAVNPIFRSD